MQGCSTLKLTLMKQVEKNNVIKKKQQSAFLKKKNKTKEQLGQLTKCENAKVSWLFLS